MSSPSELDRAATRLLVDDSNRELCRACGGQGDDLGVTTEIVLLDKKGRETEYLATLRAYECPACGSRWHEGEGRAKGLGTDASPVFLEEHLARRRREREVYYGTGKPEVQDAGVYSRPHVARAGTGFGAGVDRSGE